MNKVQLPVVITPTRAELGARCHRRHFLADILGKARYVSPSLAIGSVAHTGFAAHWLKQDVNGLMAQEWVKQKLDDSSKISLKTLESILDQYAREAKLAGPFTDQGDWKLVDVEQRFEIPLKDIKLSFQCDRIVYDKEQNWMVVVDSKTAGRLDARWDKQWEMSLQMKLYRAGAKQVFDTGGRIDIVVEGVLKDIPSVIRYYVCPEWSDSLLAEAAHNAYVIANMDRDVIEQGSTESLPLVNGVLTSVPDLAKIEQLAVNFTPVNYMDCYSYGIECPFRRLCTADVEERVAILHGEYFDTEEESY